MRPINLIPEDERRAEHTSLSSGAFGWSIVGALVLGVIAVVVLSSTSSSIAEREADVVIMEQREADARAEAERLRPYVDFRDTAEARKMTVADLAQSRFDWERVMRELALIMPDDIVLESLTATVVPSVSVANVSTVSMRSEVEGPALELIGCGAGAPDESQEAVARFITALYDIGGVTRVAVPEAMVGGESEGGSDDLCAGHAQVSTFEAVVAFDHAPIAGEERELIPVEPGPEAVNPDTVPAGEERGPMDPAEEADGGARESAAEADRRATAATETFIPGG